MSKDRVSIFIPNINQKVLSVNDISWTQLRNMGNWAVHHSNKKEKKYPRRIPKYQHGSMRCKSGFIDVEYLKYSPDYGDLLLSFSVSELYFFNNAIPKSVVDPEDLAKRILSDLQYVMDITQLPSWDTWKVIKDETNVDIIDSQENIQRRMDILSKSQMPYRKVDNEYRAKGSVYFRGRTGKRSASQFIAYDKIKEQLERKGEDLRNLLHLNPRQGCLRLELKTGKDPLKRNVKLVRHLSGVSNQNTASNFSLVMSQNFQVTILMEAITKLKLDKIITTRSNLIRIIKNSGKFTKRTLATALKVLYHENGEKYAHRLNTRTINYYCKIIYSTGYHVLYSDVELKPIKLNMVIEAVSSDLKHIRI